jgi:hypothetical protein
MSGMNKTERDQLIRLVKARARQAKQEADRRAAVLQVEIEQEITAEYSARDELWADAVAIAEEAAHKANEQIRARCADLGIPPQHAPTLDLRWYGRSPSYTDRDRVAELRKLAQARLAALTKTAKTEIDAKALDVETELIAGGLETDAAKAFAEAMPTPEQLMPALSLDDLSVKRWQPADGIAHELMAPLTTTDRRRRKILRAIEANPNASDRELAKIVGVDHKTIAAHRRRAAGEIGGEFPTSTGDVPDDEREDGEATP